MNIASIGPASFDPVTVAKQFFQKADTNKDGAISQAEMSAQFRKVSQEMLSPAIQGTSGIETYNQRNAIASAVISSLSNIYKAYDSRDLNNDGTVSYMEQILYDFTHPEPKQSTPTAQNTNDKLQTAVTTLINTLQMGTHYNAQGGFISNTSGVQSLFSIFA